MKKETKFIHGFVSILFLAVIMFTAIVLWDAEPQMPLAAGCVIAGLIAWRLGWKWDEILSSMLDGINQSLEAVLILMSIGILVSVWIAAGTVPTMIYCGLKIVNPNYFLPATFLLCSAISMFVGSWGTAGTVGIAFIGIGQMLSVPLPMVAGAIVAGSYFGDKLSPFSDGTNLAAAVSGTNIFDMICSMLPVVLPAWGCSAILYLFLGLNSVAEDINLDDELAPMMTGLDASFHIGFMAILPLVVMLVCVLLKLPSLLAILVGAMAGGVVAMLVQGCSPSDLLFFASSGYLSQTGFDALDELLSAGGIESMMRTISIIIVAMAFGGLMRGTGQMNALTEPVVKRVRSASGMLALTICTCVGVNIMLPDQYLGIAVPAQMYASEFDRRGLDRTILGNALGAGAAVTSPLIPWNTCGVYMASILGVNTLQYAPFAFFNFLLPITMMIWGVFRYSARRSLCKSK